jgi:hypothetical protein
MPRTRAQAKIAAACSPCGAEAPLFRLPVETRLQIYGLLLLADFYGGDKGRASDKLDDAADNDAIDNDVVDHDAIDNDAASEEPSTQPPTYDNRQVYGQLLLVCKMIHIEAAPLFYSRVTFVVKEPFKFANKFLRMLSAYKITSIRHLELRLSWWDFRRANWKCRSKVLNNLITVFKTYRELSNLNSLTLTMHGRLWYRVNQPQFLDFRPIGAWPQVYYTSEEIMNCMWKAGQALANTMAIAGFDISKHVEEVDEKNAAVGNITSRRAVARVKVQRKE